MIVELQQFVQDHQGCLCISKWCNTEHRVWIGISEYDVTSCLVDGKAKRIFLFPGVSTPMTDRRVQEQKQWHSTVQGYLSSLGYRVGDKYDETTRITVYGLSELDRFCLVRFCCPARVWFSAWRQMARCSRCKEEMIKKACHPSRLPQI